MITVGDFSDSGSDTYFDPNDSDSGSDSDSFDSDDFDFDDLPLHNNFVAYAILDLIVVVGLSIIGLLIFIGSMYATFIWSSFLFTVLFIFFFFQARGLYNEVSTTNEAASTETPSLLSPCSSWNPADFIRWRLPSDIADICTDSGVDMSPFREACSIFDGAILRSAVEEAIRSHAKKKMAKTADRLRSEAEEVFGAKLVAELGKIITASERTLELARREFSDKEEEQVGVDNASSDESNARSVDNGIHMTELHRTAADILMEYRIIGNDEKPKKIQAAEHSIIAPHGQRAPNNSPASEPELPLPRPNMNHHHGSEDDLLRSLSLTSSDVSSSELNRSFELNAPPSSPVDEPPQRTAKCEAGDNKDLWRDNDNDEEEEEIPSRRATFPFARVAPQNSLTRWLASSQTPRPRPSSSPARPRHRSRSPVNPHPTNPKNPNPTNLKKIAHPHPIDKTNQFRQRSPFHHHHHHHHHPPALSQPILTGSEVSEVLLTATMSRQLPEKEDGSRRKQPMRKSKSAGVMLTYNVRDIFEGKVGSLDGPEYRLF
ncbi:hypothetical protein F5Y07DRAFT_413221 [Xylaria sp. FL0933]|nr:hypothetical protein F5Y07DRAFT_413221 [Xylaria sp. FL0933]